MNSVKFFDNYHREIFIFLRKFNIFDREKDVLVVISFLILHFFNLFKNNSFKEKLLSPFLNVYFPISFSILSITLRLTGIFASLFLFFVMFFQSINFIFYEIIFYGFSLSTFIHIFLAIDHNFKIVDFLNECKFLLKINT